MFAFPMVMGCGILYEYFVDKSSGQCKASMNQLFNEANVFTPKDTAVVTPNSETPSAPSEAAEEAGMRPVDRTLAHASALRQAGRAGR